MNTLKALSTLPGIVNRSINAIVGRYIAIFIETSVTFWAMGIAVQRYLYREEGAMLSRMHCNCIVNATDGRYIVKFVEASATASTIV